ncbi:MAG: metallophosphoesterase [Bacteroidales bacterium]|nr:metallophosphoesterase [Bacteroidales bacterium]
MKNKIILFATIIFLMTSCSKDNNLDMLGMFTSISASSNERFKQSKEYNETNGYDKVIVNQDDYKLYVMSDTHVDFSTKNLDTFVETYLSDTGAAPFALHLGDQINASSHWDYYAEHVQPIFDAGRTLYHALGNHDLYYDQWNEFRKRWHTATYWLEVITPSGMKDIFICLDSANGTLGTDQRDWLEELLKEKSQENYRNIIVYTHSHFFKKDTSQGHTSNFTMEETYDLTELFSKYHVSMVLQGHSHSRDFTIFKGVEYLRVDAIEDSAEKAFYTILTVGDKIDYDFVKVN